MTLERNCSGFRSEADGMSMDRVFFCTLNIGMVKEV